MGTITPLFADIFNTSNLNINDKQLDNIIKFVSNQNYSKSGKFSGIEDISLISSDLYILNNKKLKFLKKVIEDDFNAFMKDDLLYENKFKITTSWSTKTKPNSISHWHNHSNSYYSGVLYLNTNEKTGAISFNKFMSPTFTLKPKMYNFFNCRTHLFNLKPKQVLYFPSNIYHKIEKNESNIIRYSIAFNILPTGKVGWGDSEIFL